MKREEFLHEQQRFPFVNIHLDNISSLGASLVFAGQLWLMSIMKFQRFQMPLALTTSDSDA